MALPEILIGSKFDAKGFKQAETATDKLGKSIKNLAYSFGLVFSAQRLISFGKASVKAFAEDENAARSLGMTLKNLNLDYLGASESVNSYISNLEKQTGVLDDELRPAMDRLLRATGSLTESQKLLSLALDISAGTGKNLTTVSQGLQKAYLGNNASLGRLGVGLTKAELSTSTFLQIQERLTELFAGQATSAAESYLGSMNKLTIASNNAKEIIGKDLLDAMQMIAGDEGIGGATTAMEGFATQIGNVITGISVLAVKLKAIPGAGFIGDILSAGAQISGLGLLSRLGESSKARSAGTPAQSPGQRKAIDKANADALKLQKTQNSLKKIDNDATARKITLTADQQALEELKKKFDVERVGLFSALGSAQSEEERLRIRSLIAIKDNDAALAGKIQAELNAAKATDYLSSALFRLSAEFDMERTRMALGRAQVAATAPMGGISPIASSQAALDTALKLYPDFGTEMDAARSAAARGGVTVNINNAGSVTTDRDLVSMVTNAIYNNQASGIPINYSTSYV
jgi:hypothetical protein